MSHRSATEEEVKKLAIEALDAGKDEIRVVLVLHGNKGALNVCGPTSEIAELIVNALHSQKSLFRAITEKMADVMVTEIMLGIAKGVMEDETKEPQKNHVKSESDSLN